MMRWTLATLVVIHGLIHLLGFVKAFGLYEPAQLTRAISRPWGIVWLAACFSMVTTAALLAVSSRTWWLTGLAAVLVSQAAIISSWADARYGTAANVLILVGIVYGVAAQGPSSFAAQYRRAVEERLQKPMPLDVVSEADLAGLPPPLRRYLYQVGVVGEPRVRDFRATWRGRIRHRAEDPWMSFTAEQHSFPSEPARFFLMKARRAGLPVDVYHAFEGESARMRVRLLSLFPMVDARGAEMTRAETVTLFNDLCLFAPSELVDPAIRWETIDERSVRGVYTVGPNTISALLRFNEAGELVDFVSEDRLAASADGTRFVKQRWSTPVGEPKRFGRLRLPSRGVGRWHPPEGELSYIEIELLDLRINTTAGGQEIGGADGDR